MENNNSISNDNYSKEIIKNEKKSRNNQELKSI